MAKFAQIDPNTGKILVFLEGVERDWPDLATAGVLRRYTGKLDRDAIWQDDKFVDPPAAPAVRIISALAFRRRLTRAERRQLTRAAATATAQGDTDLQEALDDIGCSVTIDLDGEDIREWLNVFIGAGLLTGERVAELLM